MQQSLLMMFSLQPIRGDWRTKVKVAKKASQKVADKEEAPAKEAPLPNPVPDLSEHNKGLPPGWQAIWDPTSKGVYFGNIVTKVASFPTLSPYLAALNKLVPFDGNYPSVRVAHAT